MDKPTDAGLKRAIGMLEGILTRQIALHTEMLKVAEDKQQGIVQGDLEKLEQAVAREKKLVAEIEDEEKRRQAVMPLVKKGLGLDDSVEKLADVVAAMPEPEKTGMRAIREELKGLLEACQVKTRHNAELLKASLEHVEAFLKTISDAAAQDANYKRDGKRSNGGPTMIDRSA